MKGVLKIIIILSIVIVLFLLCFYFYLASKDENIQINSSIGKIVVLYVNKQELRERIFIYNSQISKVLVNIKQKPNLPADTQAIHLSSNPDVSYSLEGKIFSLDIFLADEMVNSLTEDKLSDYILKEIVYSYNAAIDPLNVNFKKSQLDETIKNLPKRILILLKV